MFTNSQLNWVTLKQKPGYVTTMGPQYHLNDTLRMCVEVGVLVPVIDEASNFTEGFFFFLSWVTKIEVFACTWIQHQNKPENKPENKPDNKRKVS